MIAVFPSKTVSIASTETNEYLEKSVAAITPPPEFSQEYGEDAVLAADNCRVKSGLNTQQILDLAFSLQSQKKRLKRKEFSSFVQNILKWSQDTTRKYLNIAKTYALFPDLSVLLGIEPFMLLQLCSKKYTKVVERLKEEVGITQLRVVELIKELVPKPQKKKKESTLYGDAVLQRHPNAEDGTFYFTLKEVNLSDQVGLWLEEKLQTRTVGQLLEQAAEWEKALQVEHPTDYRLAQLEELDLVIEDARAQRAAVAALNLELKKEKERNLDLEQRVAELEQMVVGQHEATTPEPEPDSILLIEAEPEPRELGVPDGMHSSELSSVPPPEVLANQMLQCQSWTEVTQLVDNVAEAIGEERATVFVSAVKRLTTEQRSHLVSRIGTTHQQFSARSHFV